MRASDVALAGGLLGTHVLGRADDHAAAGEAFARVGEWHIEGARDAEVGDERAPSLVRSTFRA